MYYYGEGVEKNKKLAFKWYEKAAKQGYTQAQNNLALMYEKGEWVDKNEKLAKEWFTKAAEEGDERAQSNLASLYYNGKGIEKNDKLAIKWYSKAAKQGLLEAQYNLGLLYERGEGVKQDKVIALKWFHEAANQGDGEALIEISRYVEGNKLASLGAYASVLHIQKQKSLPDTEASKLIQKAATKKVHKAIRILKPFQIPTKFSDRSKSKYQQE